MLELILGLVWVAAGSALGGIARFAISGLVARAIGETFPWGTMTVNVTGSAGLGALAALGSAGHVGPLVWQLAAIGFCGSYTTVSSFSLQTLALARDGEYGRAAANLGLSLGLCLGGAFAGYAGAAALAHWG